MAKSREVKTEEKQATQKGQERRDGARTDSKANVTIAWNTAIVQSGAQRREKEEEDKEAR